MRRKEGEEVFGLTFSLLTTSEGIKMGKTVKGAVWLDENKTPPYELYQYLRNVADADVIKCLKLLTFVPIEEIREMEKWEGSKLNDAKVRLAYEVTKMIHGVEAADKAKATAEALFSGAADSEHMNTTQIPAELITADGVNLLEAMLLAKIIPSKGEGRRLIQQGGVFLDNEKITDFNANIPLAALENGAVVRKGKKTFHKFTK